MSKAPTRQLQPLTGRTLGIHAEYQLAALDPSTAAYVQSIVDAAIETIQSYLTLSTTSPPGPLLIPPIYYDQFNCDRANDYDGGPGSEP